MRSVSKNKKSIYFPMLIREIEHPLLHQYLLHKSEEQRGKAKKLICDAAEALLKKEQSAPTELDEYSELIRRLDEIQKLLESGVVLHTESEKEEIHTQSKKVSALLSAFSS